MSKGKYLFKQTDLTRAIKAVEATGIKKKYRVEINDSGKPVVIVGIELEVGGPEAQDSVSDLDAWRKKRDGRKA